VSVPDQYGEWCELHDAREADCREALGRDSDAPCVPSQLQSAIFDFSSLVTVILLFIVTCTYLRGFRKTIFDNAPTPDGNINRHEGLVGLCWKASRIGERVSEYVSAACIIMAIHVLFIKK
jgi:hypothetical protein